MPGDSFGFRKLDVELARELSMLAPNWENVERVLHLLWSDASAGLYRKEMWAGFERLLSATRASSAR